MVAAATSLTGRYDDDNIFARIIRGEMDVTMVLQDDQVLAFMDAFPQSPGHVLVVPRASAARNLLDIDGSELAPLVLAVQRVARAIAKALLPDGISVLQFNGAAGGQTVFHLHFHVIPRWSGSDLKPHAQGLGADLDELRQLASRIAGAL